MCVGNCFADHLVGSADDCYNRYQVPNIFDKCCYIVPSCSMTPGLKVMVCQRGVCHPHGWVGVGGSKVSIGMQCRRVGTATYMNNITICIYSNLLYYMIQLFTLKSRIYAQHYTILTNKK